MNRRTEITIETHRLLVIRSSGTSIRARCDQCDQWVQMVTPNQAAAIAHVAVRTINRWVEAESIHFAESPEGLLLICLNSISS
jgi:hypothetical protein